MVSVKSLIPAIAAAVVSTAALAADLPLPPPVAYQPPPPPCCEVSGWYLRGDVGVGFQNFKSFDHDQTNPAFVWPASWTINQQEIKDATILGFGIGYEFNSWLRFDITGEYRTKVVGKVTGSKGSNGRCKCQKPRHGNGLRAAWHIISEFLASFGFERARPAEGTPRDQFCQHDCLTQCPTVARFASQLALRAILISGKGETTRQTRHPLLLEPDDELWFGGFVCSVKNLEFEINRVGERRVHPSVSENVPHCPRLARRYNDSCCRSEAKA